MPVLLRAAADAGILDPEQLRFLRQVFARARERLPAEVETDLSDKMAVAIIRSFRMGIRNEAELLSAAIRAAGHVPNPAEAETKDTSASHLAAL